MKKQYQKPTLDKRDRLSDTTARVILSGDDPS